MPAVGHVAAALGHRDGCFPGVTLGVLGVSPKGLPHLIAQFRTLCKGICHRSFQEKVSLLKVITRGNQVVTMCNSGSSLHLWN